MNDNKENNYVIPTKVETNSVNNVENQNAFLNRERENIISATIQANSNINVDEANKANEAIKVKKRNVFKDAIIILIVLAIAGALIFYGVSYLKKHDKKEKEKTTTVVTTTSVMEKINKYITSDVIRKFESNDETIILFPTNYNLNSNNGIFIDLIYSDDNISSEMGTYKINVEGKTLKLINEEEKKEKDLNIISDGLSTKDKVLVINDAEMKSFISKNDDKNSILFINAKERNEIFVLIESTKENNISNTYKYEETMSEIILNNEKVYIKDGLNLTYDNLIYEYIEN